MLGPFRLESYKEKNLCASFFFFFLAKQKDILDQGKESLTLP